jgi:hypothetical protein
MTATVGMDYPITWNINDVDADRTTLTNTWGFMEGARITTGASGTVTNRFMTPGTHSIRLHTTDKDGGDDEVWFTINVLPSKRVIGIPIGPNTSSFYGMTGTGYGWIDAPDLEPANWTFTTNVYTFYFGATVTQARLHARPDQGHVLPLAPLLASDRKSYFFVWEGPAEAFADPADYTRPRYSGTDLGVTVINLPNAATGGTAGQPTEMVKVRAIFSLEKEIGDGMGDINQDGIPDEYVERYFIKPAEGGGSGADATGIDPIWFMDLSTYNEDNDFWPVNAGGVGGVYDFRPIPGPNNWNAFTAWYEIRGFDGLFGPQPVGSEMIDDDPHTNPTLSDTDGDGFPDGWEYWFWEAA